MKSLTIMVVILSIVALGVVAGEANWPLLLSIVGMNVGRSAGYILALTGPVLALSALVFALSRLILSSKRSRILLTVATPLLLIVGVGIGSADSGSAYNDCLSRGERVREALQAYKWRHGEYPQTLAALQIRPVPCRTLLAGSILRYSRTKAGYSLRFEDPLVANQADEIKPFENWMK